MLWLTVLLGVVCSLHASWLFLRFLVSPGLGAQAVRWMLFGEAVGMIMFTQFAYLEMTGEITLLSKELATIMRWVAMVATLASTVHLRVMICKIDSSQ